MLGYRISWGENVRGEDDGLADHLARRVGRDVDSVGSSARSATNEGGVARASPATMADVGLRDLAGVSVGSISSQHTETLIFVSKKGDKRKKGHLPRAHFS